MPVCGVPAGLVAVRPCQPQWLLSHHSLFTPHRTPHPVLLTAYSYDSKISSFEDDEGAYDQKDAAGFIKLQVGALLCGTKDCCCAIEGWVHATPPASSSCRCVNSYDLQSLSGLAPARAGTALPCALSLPPPLAFTQPPACSMPCAPALPTGAAPPHAGSQPRRCLAQGAALSEQRPGCLAAVQRAGAHGSCCAIHHRTTTGQHEGLPGTGSSCASLTASSSGIALAICLQLLLLHPLPVCARNMPGTARRCSSYLPPPCTPSPRFDCAPPC